MPFGSLSTDVSPPCRGATPPHSEGPGLFVTRSVCSGSPKPPKAGLAVLRVAGTDRRVRWCRHVTLCALYCGDLRPASPCPPAALPRGRVTGASSLISDVRLEQRGGMPSTPDTGATSYLPQCDSPRRCRASPGLLTGPQGLQGGSSPCPRGVCSSYTRSPLGAPVAAAGSPPLCPGPGPLCTLDLSHGCCVSQRCHPPLTWCSGAGPGPRPPQGQAARGA